jgi:hypothetical protein
MAQLEPVLPEKHFPPNTQHAIVLGPFGVCTSLSVAPSQVGTVGEGLGPAVKHVSISVQVASAGASYAQASQVASASLSLPKFANDTRAPVATCPARRASLPGQATEIRRAARAI